MTPITVQPVPKAPAPKFAARKAAPPRVALHTHGAEAAGTADYSGTATPSTVDNGPLLPGTGPTMSKVKVALVFWLPTGSHFDSTKTDAADAQYENLMAQWVKDVSGTPYANVLSQYYSPGTNAHISNVISLLGTWTDTAAYPRNAGTTDNPLVDADIQAEVSKAVIANAWEPDVSTLVAVFTAYGIESCQTSTDCTFATGSPNSECAYHGYTDVSGSDQPYADLSDVGCNSLVDNAPNQVTPNHDVAAESTLSSFTHETFEAATDPLGSSWVTSQGNEIGDLCDVKYETQNDNGADLYLNGHPYLVQMEYSNAAKGCVLDYSSSTADFTHAPTIAGSSSLSSTSPAQGDTITYTMNLSNYSNTSSAQNVSVAGALTGTTVVKAVDGSGSPADDGFVQSVNGSTFTVSYSNLAVHQTRQFIVTATVNTAGQRAAPCPTSNFNDWISTPMPAVSMCGQSTKTIPVNGSVAPVTTSTVGKIADMQFTITNSTIIPYYSAEQTQGLAGCGTSTGLTYSIAESDGTVIQNVAVNCGSSTGNAGMLFNPMLFPAGTYQITITPGGLVDGTYDVQIIPSGAGPTVTPNGAAAAATTTSPGQATVLQVGPAANSGDLWSSYGLSLNTCTGALVAFFAFASSGREIDSNAVNCNSSSGKGSGAAFRPTFDAYNPTTILVVPESQIDGTYNFSYYGALDDRTGSEVPATSAVTSMTIPTNGQSAYGWFTMPSTGGPFTITDTAAISNCDKVNAPVTIVIWDPDNGYAALDFAPCDGYASTPLVVGSAANYQGFNLFNIQVIPSPGASGSMTFQMTTGANMTTVPLDGTSTSETLGQASQSAVMKFTTTTANQAISGTCSVASGYSGSQANYLVYDNSGKLLQEFLYGGCASGVVGSTMFSPPMTVTAAGTYYIVVNPNDDVLNPQVGGLSATWTFSLT